MNKPKILTPEARLTLLEYCCGTKWVSIDMFRKQYNCKFPDIKNTYAVMTTGNSYGQWLLEKEVKSTTINYENFNDNEQKFQLDQELIVTARYLRDDIHCSLKILRTDYDYSLFRNTD